MYPALILAGGASKRMGKQKATMLIDGVQMVVRVAHALRDGGCSTIYVAVRDGHQRLELMGSLAHLNDVEFFLDGGVERSAKAGLKSALQICQSRGVSRIQLAPCDTPWIEGCIFERLRCENHAVVIPRAIRLQPLLALIEVDLVLKAILSAKHRDSLTRILRKVPNMVIDFENDGPFRNVNSPNDTNS